MLWGQRIKVYTDHKNLIQDALGLTSDRVYQWRLLLEECGAEIIHIKGIHNTVADAISRLDYSPVHNQRDTWMTFTQCWSYYASHRLNLDKVFSVILNPNYDKLNKGYASGTPLARVVVSFPPQHAFELF